MKYMCKCGTTFDRSTNAATTGYRLEEMHEEPYGPGHPCYGCPYVKEILRWDRLTEQFPRKIYECRAAKERITYQTEAATINGGTTNLSVQTLDREFIGAVYERYHELMEFPPEDSFYDFASQGVDDSEGREQYSLSFPKNKRGVEIKAEILRQFFASDFDPVPGTWHRYHRKEAWGEDTERFLCRNRIEYMKERFKMGDIERRIYQETGASGRYYFVHDMGGGRFKVHTAYKLGDMHDPDKIYPSFYFRFCTTFEEAQAALDLTARIKDWTEVQPDEPESQLPEGGFDELYPEEDESAEDLVEEENHGIAIEDHTSLRMEAFNEIMDLADARLNMALRKCLSSESTERFDLTIKITFEAAQGRVKPVMQESGYKFEPASYKVKTGVLDDIEIVLNSNGDPVILNNRPKQMTMEDYYGQD